MPRRPVEPDQMKRWVAFLHNRKDAIAAMDFFTVPTASLRLLHGFFVIDHGRRHILHFNATYNPTAAWVIQQLREAFPYDAAPKYLILDRDAIFRPEVMRFINAIGTTPRRISYRSPWQNPVAERWIGSCRRELLQHVVVLGQRHLVRLVRSYIRYYQEDRQSHSCPRLRAEALASSPFSAKRKDPTKIRTLCLDPRLSRHVRNGGLRLSQ